MTKQLIVAAAVAGTMAWAVRGRSSSVFGPSVWRGNPRRKSIALTFDDGPSPATLRILEILREYDAPATFFQVGRSVLRYPHIARAVSEAGHEIGNHSQTHSNLTFKSPARIETEFAAAQKAILAVTGRTPILLRAPYGVRWPGFRRAQSKLGLTGVMWTVIARDWTLPAAAIARRVIDGATDGGIVCLHDGRGTLELPDARATVDAVRIIVPELLRKGYHLETVSQLLCPAKPVPII